jgi:hypothetical protein
MVREKEWGSVAGLHPREGCEFGDTFYWEVSQAGQDRAQVIARPDAEPPNKILYWLPAFSQKFFALKNPRADTSSCAVFGQVRFRQLKNCGQRSEC